MDPFVLHSFGGELIKTAISARLVLAALKRRAATKGVRVAPKMMQAAEQAAAKGLKSTPASVRRTALGAADSAKGVAKGRQTQRFVERHSRTTGAVKVTPSGKADVSGLKARGQQSVKRRVQGGWNRALKNPDAVRRQGSEMGKITNKRSVVAPGQKERFMSVGGPKAFAGSDMGATGTAGALQGGRGVGIGPRVESRAYTPAHISSLTGKGTAAAPGLQQGLARMRAGARGGPPTVATRATAVTGAGTPAAMASKPAVRVSGTAPTQLSMAGAQRPLSGAGAAYQKTMFSKMRPRRI